VWVEGAHRLDFFRQACAPERWESRAALTMSDKDIISPWHPMQGPLELAIIGKLQEELCELGAALARCLIQGLYAVEPESGKPNFIWLAEEVTDVEACLEVLKSNLLIHTIPERRNRKIAGYRRWHDMLLGKEP
jgi:hypothetical protein